METRPIGQGLRVSASEDRHASEHVGRQDDQDRLQPEHCHHGRPDLGQNDSRDYHQRGADDGQGEAPADPRQMLEHPPGCEAPRIEVNQ